MRHRNSMAAALGMLAASAGFAASAALAHHSVSASYDTGNLVEFTGVITDVVLRNPHGFVELAVTDGDGIERIWTIEMAAPNALVRRGIQPRELLAAGSRVTISAWPAKDGTQSASGHLLTLADGTTVDITDTFGRAAGLNVWSNDVPAPGDPGSADDQ